VQSVLAPDSGRLMITCRWGVYKGRMPATQQQKHEAGRHLVVAEALLHGYPAKTVGRSSFVDVNGQQAEVHVAAKGSWQIANVDKFLAGTIDRVVLVDITGKVPEFYILDGDRLRTIVKRNHDRFIERVGTRPRNPESKHTRIDPGLVRRFRNRWTLFD
jgi:hypothetical protein